MPSRTAMRPSRQTSSGYFAYSSRVGRVQLLRGAEDGEVGVEEGGGQCVLRRGVVLDGGEDEVFDAVLVAAGEVQRVASPPRAGAFVFAGVRVVDDVVRPRGDG